MGKAYLTEEEVRRIFPTVSELTHRCRGEDKSRWGLLQRENEMSFGRADDSWILQISQRDILMHAEKFYPSCRHDNLFVYHSVNVVSGDIDCLLISLAPGKLLETVPSFGITNTAYH